MNDKIRIPDDLVQAIGGDYRSYNRADIEALLAEQGRNNLVVGSIVFDEDENIYHSAYGACTVACKPLDWETLGYTIAQNYPEAEWFAVEPSIPDECFYILFFESEPEELIRSWLVKGSRSVTSRVTLPPGVDWKTTKRRIERI